jgi:uncharacterized protein (TIGR02145 family)
MKNKFLLFIAFPVFSGLIQCAPEKEKSPLAMFTVVPNADGPFYYAGRNVIFNASWSEDYSKNGSLTFFWYYDTYGSDTSNSLYPYAREIFMETGYHTVKLMVKNEVWENAETIRNIEIVDSNLFYEFNAYDTLYFPLIESYLACRDLWLDRPYAWTRNDLAAPYGEYSISCSTYKSGFRYTWENAMNFNSAGFRIPSRNEWEILFDAFGGIEIAGLVFQEPSQTFMDLPYAGKADENNTCVDAGLKSYYWTSDLEGQDSAWAVVFEKNSIAAKFIKLPAVEALSVKLVY